MPDTSPDIPADLDAKGGAKADLVLTSSLGADHGSKRSDDYAALIASFQGVSLSAKRLAEIGGNLFTNHLRENLANLPCHDSPCRPRPGRMS